MIACGTPVFVLDTNAVKELVWDENGIELSRLSMEVYLLGISKFSRNAFVKSKNKKNDR